MPNIFDTDTWRAQLNTLLPFLRLELKIEVGDEEIVEILKQQIDPAKIAGSDKTSIIVKSKTFSELQNYWTQYLRAVDAVYKKRFNQK